MCSSIGDICNAVNKCENDTPYISPIDVTAPIMKRDILKTIFFLVKHCDKQDVTIRGVNKTRENSLVANLVLLATKWSCRIRVPTSWMRMYSGVQDRSSVDEPSSAEL